MRIEQHIPKFADLGERQKTWKIRDVNKFISDDFFTSWLNTLKNIKDIDLLQTSICMKNEYGIVFILKNDKKVWIADIELHDFDNKDEIVTKLRNGLMKKNIIPKHLDKNGNQIFKGDKVSVTSFGKKYNATVLKLKYAEGTQFGEPKVLVEYEDKFYGNGLISCYKAKNVIKL